MSSWVKEVFGTEKPVIGMIHVQAMPGAPTYDEAGGMERLIRGAQADRDALVAGGVDAVMFCNEYDRPYLTRVGPEVIAAMTRVVAEVSRGLPVPFGVDVLWDPVAAISIANATGASFVREVFTGVYSSDLGLWDTCAGEALRFRRNIGATRVRLFYNIVPEFAAPLAERPLETVARTAVFSSLADGICVSGYMAGAATPLDALKKVKDTLPDTPVFANTGVTPETVAKILEIADGCVVGTAFKEDRKTFSPVSRANVVEFMEKVKAFRAHRDAR
ncbi:MAG: BtpA/SgcQ family protein [Firmicutes bacterium]|nr:BtpA/SgcQ family protein [Bacillota bacterium]